MEPPPPPPSSQQPSSPGVSPVQLKDCIEELLEFTLRSSIQGKLHTGLSNEYCANLLRDDPSNALATSNEVCKGVPSYPLYKRLALSLYQSIHSGALCTAYKELIPVPEDCSLKKKGEEWNKLIVEKGSALLSMLKEVDFELHVQEPFFSQLNDGLKTIEGRCAVGDYKRIKSGHLLLFNKCLTLQVQDIRQYASFHEMLEAESLRKVLPGVSSIEEGSSGTGYVFDEELEGLSYGGVQKLLGFVETMGTNSELLPPPTSTLLSTFLTPHNPDVKGSTLTNGARALAKHANRSSEGYWGALHGSDSEKNRHAVDVINRLLTQCSWMNMHIVQPHGSVFEIRTDDGYGARWSGDGTKFIGFLEPYMVDGHSSGWKH